MIYRILVSSLLLFSIIFLPFWLVFILAFLGMIYFNIFYEAAVLFFLSDLLFGLREAKFSYIIFISFIMAIFILIVIEVTKKKLKFYPA